LRRPTIDQLIPQLNQLQVPTLIMIGDEDDPCVEPSIMVKRAIPRSGLAVLPQCGHAINLEEPALFNQLVADFLASVEAGKWAEHPLGDTPYTTGSR
jgi:pimeloyl-ACP methyl ester carboxylesterase